MEKEPITVNGLKKLKDELIYLKEKDVVNVEFDIFGKYIKSL